MGLRRLIQNAKRLVGLPGHGEDLPQQHADAGNPVGTSDLHHDPECLGQLVVDDPQLAALVIATGEADPGAGKTDMGDAVGILALLRIRQSRKVHFQRGVQLTLGMEDGRIGSVCIYEVGDRDAIREHGERIGALSDDVRLVRSTAIKRADPEPVTPV